MLGISLPHENEEISKLTSLHLMETKISNESNFIENMSDRHRQMAMLVNADFPSNIPNEITVKVPKETKNKKVMYETFTIKNGEVFNGVGEVLSRQEFEDIVRKARPLVEHKIQVIGHVKHDEISGSSETLKRTKAAQRRVHLDTESLFGKIAPIMDNMAFGEEISVWDLINDDRFKMDDVLKKQFKALFGNDKKLLQSKKLTKADLQNIASLKTQLSMSSFDPIKNPNYLGRAYESVGQAPSATGSLIYMPIETDKGIKNTFVVDDSKDFLSKNPKADMIPKVNTVQETVLPDGSVHRVRNVITHETAENLLLYNVLKETVDGKSTEQIRLENEKSHTKMIKTVLGQEKKYIDKTGVERTINDFSFNNVFGVNPKVDLPQELLNDPNKISTVNDYNTMVKPLYQGLFAEVPVQKNLIRATTERHVETIRQNFMKSIDELDFEQPIKDSIKKVYENMSVEDITDRAMKIHQTNMSNKQSDLRSLSSMTSAMLNTYNKSVTGEELNLEGIATGIHSASVDRDLGIDTTKKTTLLSTLAHISNNNNKIATLKWQDDELIIDPESISIDTEEQKTVRKNNKNRKLQKYHEMAKGLLNSSGDSLEVPEFLKTRFDLVDSVHPLKNGQRLTESLVGAATNATLTEELAKALKNQNLSSEEYTKINKQLSGLLTTPEAVDASTYYKTKRSNDFASFLGQQVAGVFALSVKSEYIDPVIDNMQQGLESTIDNVFKVYQEQNDRLFNRNKNKDDNKPKIADANPLIPGLIVSGLALSLDLYSERTIKQNKNMVLNLHSYLRTNQKPFNDMITSIDDMMTSDFKSKPRQFSNLIVNTAKTLKPLMSSWFKQSKNLLEKGIEHGNKNLSKNTPFIMAGVLGAGLVGAMSNVWGNVGKQQYESKQNAKFDENLAYITNNKLSDRKRRDYPNSQHRPPINKEPLEDSQLQQVPRVLQNNLSEVKDGNIPQFIPDLATSQRSYVQQSESIIPNNLNIPNQTPQNDENTRRAQRYDDTRKGNIGEIFHKKNQLYYQQEIEKQSRNRPF